LMERNHKNFGGVGGLPDDPRYIACAGTCEIAI
jgi:hypothetical protein